MLIDIFLLKFPKIVNGILNVGAHECEERLKYLSKFNCLSDDDIIWIDALEDKVTSIKLNNPSIQIFNECISNKDNEVISFYITNNYQSSSILKLKEHLIEYPDIYEISNIEMKTKTLKTFYNEHNFKYDKFNFIALDIQGAELLALQGANDILNHIDYIYIRVNTKELYENCPLFEDIDAYLSKFNFSMQHILMTEHGWGDAFYIKDHFNISSNFKILYGTDLIKNDITEYVLTKSVNKDNIIYIPSRDENRAALYGDPIYGQVKNIFIETNADSYIIDHTHEIYINTNNNILSLNNTNKNNNLSENILLQYYNNGIKIKPNFTIPNTEHKIYRFNNVHSYTYKFCMTEIEIQKKNISLKENPTYYFISDDFGLTAFGHWVFESLIFFKILEDLNKIYPNIKILTTNKKKYVKNFYKFVGINNEIVYDINDYNNVCFIPPLSSINCGLNLGIFDYYNNQLIDKICKNSSILNYSNNILFLPRNIKENYFPDDKFPLHLLSERRNQDEINYISDGVIKNGGIVLNTYEINNLFIQFSIIMNSKNIIVDHGSSYFVNCIACKNKNIIVLNSGKINHHIELEPVKYLHTIIEANNNVNILTDYNNYNDISLYLVK